MPCSLTLPRKVSSAATPATAFPSPQPQGSQAEVTWVAPCRSGSHSGSEGCARDSGTRSVPSRGSAGTAGAHLKHTWSAGGSSGGREAGQERVPDGAEHSEPLAPLPGIWQQLEEAGMAKEMCRCELAGESRHKARGQGRSGQVPGQSCSSGGAAAPQGKDRQGGLRPRWALGCGQGKPWLIRAAASDRTAQSRRLGWGPPKDPL